jgi:hypothetical protein
MKPITLAAIVALGTLVLVPEHASAVTCAAGVYRAGCAGPNGAVVVHRPPYHGYARPYYAPRPPVSCASGPYRAGCVGPNGAAVVRRRY